MSDDKTVVIVLCDGMGVIPNGGGPLTVPAGTDCYWVRELTPYRLNATKDGPPPDLADLDTWDTCYRPNGLITQEGYRIFAPDFLLRQEP